MSLLWPEGEDRGLVAARKAKLQVRHTLQILATLPLVLRPTDTQYPTSSWAMGYF